MAEEFTEGDVIRLNNTQQEGEVLEVINVISDEHHGPLLRVNLVGAKPPMIVYYPTGSVQFVRAADPEKKKKPEHKKADHDDKLGHDKSGHGKKLLT